MLAYVVLARYEEIVEFHGGLHLPTHSESWPSVVHARTLARTQAFKWTVTHMHAVAQLAAAQGALARERADTSHVVAAIMPA